MATQGIVSIISGGNMLFKVVAGSNGFNASELVEWAKSHEGAMTGEDVYQAAIKVRFGHKTDLVVQASDGSLTFDGDELRSEDFGELYRDNAKFLDPRFNPRWAQGTADHVEVVEIDEQAMLKPFTVIGVSEESGQIVCHHVLAESGLNAFAEVANTEPGISMVVAIPGHLNEGHELTFPGECMVDGETVLAQQDVFGRNTPEECDPSAFVKRFVSATLKDGMDGESRHGVCTGVIGESLIILGESGIEYECHLPASIVPLDRMWGSTRDFAISQGVQE